MNKISSYIFIQILKGCSLIFFIFVSIAWLLQLTRLISLTNLIQVDVITIIILSFYLLPNLITIIMPFVLIFGILLCFIKLHRDRELIAIYTLGLNENTLRKPIIIFTIIMTLIFILLSFYFSPNIYKKYKINEFEIRNKINFERILISNFLKIGDETVLDFKKNNNNFENIFINFFDDRDNLIFSKNGQIINDKNNYIFRLSNGFKLSINDDKEIEKLEFENYSLEINNNNLVINDNLDTNTLNIFEDFKTKNYKNISYKVMDSLLIILIVFFFYKNNIVRNNFNLNNNISYISISTFILIFNQLFKNSEFNITLYLSSIFSLIFLLTIFIYFTKDKYVQN